jgi:hypothetical protein
MRKITIGNKVIYLWPFVALGAAILILLGVDLWLG